MPTTAGSATGYPAPFRPPWWMFALAAAFAGYFALLIYSDLTRPEFTGFTGDIRDGMMTLGDVLPGSPAATAGLLKGDRVLEANHIPIHGRLDWLVVEVNLQGGRP